MNKSICLTTRYWSDCNNKCLFCSQQQMQDKFGKFIFPSKESILLHNKILFNTASRLLSNEQINLEANFIGGELFHRADMKELYEGFDDTVNILYKLNKNFNCFNIGNTSQITSATNLLYNDLSLLIHFITELKIHKLSLGLLLSYDLWGRFKNSNDIDIFVQNLMEIIKYKSIETNIGISVVLTAEAMRIISEKRKCIEFEVFEWIYKEFGLQFCPIEIDASPENSFTYATNEEILNFINTLKKNYPKLNTTIIPINRINVSIEKKYYHIQAGKLYSNSEIYNKRKGALCKIENICSEKPFCEFRSIIVEPLLDSCPFYEYVRSTRE